MNESESELIILTDGGHEHGFGHVARCTALADAASQLGCAARFIIHGDAGIADMMETYQWQINDWIDCRNEVANAIPDDALLFIDSYRVTGDDVAWYQRRFRQTVVLDDSACLGCTQGTVVSPTNFWDMLAWNVAHDVEYLVGAKYALLRKEFWSGPSNTIAPEVETILVTLGGSDLNHQLVEPWTGIA